MRKHLLLTVGLTALAGTACSKNPTTAFKLNDRCETFRIGEVKTSSQARSKVDLLFVVDNSSSMGDNQTALSNAFDGFSKRYLKPSSDGSAKDIRIGVITTDTYFAGFNEATPHDYATFKPGIHDGIRPGSGGARSGKPILSTIPANGAAADAAYFNDLTEAFKLNSKPGTNGSGAESGMSSILALLSKNERANQCQDASGASNPLCFFRGDSMRVAVFFSDAEDNCEANPQIQNWLCVPGTQRVQKFKTELDSYLKDLDVNGKANFFAAAIVGREDGGDGHLGNPARYVQYEDLIATLKSDSSNPIGQHSYSEKLQTGNIEQLLDNLGASIESVSTQRFSSFKLARTPKSLDQIMFNVLLPSGVAQPVPVSVMTLDGTTLSLSSAWLEKFPPESVLEGCYPPDAAL